ncbi:MAG TPA: kelch repeat-containing protein [Phycisphaerales bacterium]|nr:kelch repeat-containing protein [Phycisphaerales bacterium]
MAYDSARGVTVLFGGSPAFDYSGETWEWNGSAWTQRLVTGPSPRLWHAMAYDAGRGVTVLFGGATNGPNSGETWEWNGSTWTQRLVSGPSPRYQHTMAYDAARGVTVLFGGNTTGGYNDETWEWNGSTWTQRVVNGPSARANHAMAYDSGRGATVLFGGYTNGSNGANGETWEWNGSTWTQRLVNGPSARAYHAMAYDPARGVTVLFGGYTNGSNGANGETWEWNGSAWTQRVAPGPTPRWSHAMAYDAARGVTVLVGGRGPGETWEWNGSVWTQRLVSPPSPRYQHAMAHDTARGVTVMFGGGNNGDTWEWNGSTWTQRLVSGPSPRNQHAMAYDAARGVTVLFGGFMSGAYNGETWEWNGSTWTQRLASGPSARVYHAMTYDAARGVTVLFGGYNQVGGLNGETWEWNGSTWTQRLVNGPSARAYHAMAYDPARGVTVLFGGRTDLVYFGSNDETWEWNGSTWTQRLVSGPSPRYLHAMTYDAARRVTVLFGGSNDGETWEWNGSMWTQRVVSGPSQRWGHAMAYDPGHGLTVLFGGNNGVTIGETWGLGVPEPGAQVPHVPPCYQSILPPAPGRNKLVLVTHGIYTDYATYVNTWESLRDAIATHGGPNGTALGSDWAVRSYDWTCDSGRFPDPPGPILGAAIRHGLRLGSLIGEQGYQHVHLVAHSAGSGLIAAAALGIKVYALTHSQDITVHTTYLDAYGGNYIIPGGGNAQGLYGMNANWSDHYFSREEAGSYWNCALAQGEWPTGPVTQLELPECYNLDVSRLDPEYGPICHSRHSWPRCFYRYTVDGNTSDCGQIDGDAQDFGFPLSFERWQGSGGVQGWIAARTASDSPYRKGLVCRLPYLSSVCQPPSATFHVRRDPQFDFLLTTTVPSNQTAVSTTPTLLMMTTQPQGATTPAPAWVSFIVTTHAPVNVVNFDLAFTPNPGAAGLAALYVDGQACGIIDEPNTPPGSLSYAMQTVGVLAPGEHVIAFRLDPLNTFASTITIQNVATGFGETVPNCRPDFNHDGVLAVQDIFDFLNVWFESDSSADFDGVNGLQVADIFAFLNAWFAGCP